MYAKTIFAKQWSFHQWAKKNEFIYLHDIHGVPKFCQRKNGKIAHITTKNIYKRAYAFYS